MSDPIEELIQFHREQIVGIVANMPADRQAEYLKTHDAALEALAVLRGRLEQADRQNATWKRNYLQAEEEADALQDANGELRELRETAEASLVTLTDALREIGALDDGWWGEGAATPVRKAQDAFRIARAALLSSGVDEEQVLEAAEPPCVTPEEGAES
jgi:hypothetical protein